MNEKQTGASNRKPRPGAMSWLAVGRPVFNRAYFYCAPRVHCAQVRRVITKGYARSRYRIDRCGWAILVCRKIYPEQHQVNWRYVQTDDGSGT